MKRFLAVLLAMMMVLSAFPVTALAPSDVTVPASNTTQQPGQSAPAVTTAVTSGTNVTTPAPDTSSGPPAGSVNGQRPQDAPTTTTASNSLPGEDTVYYNVTFLIGGGETYTVTQVAEGKLCVEPAIPPIPADMTSFAGWFKEDNTPFDFENTPITGDISLHAVFKDTYLVKFLNADGKVIDSKEVKRGGTVAATTVDVVAPAGQVFESWYLDGSLYDFSQPVTSNLTLTPHFRDLFYVYFDSQGSYVPPQLVDVGGFITRPEDPTRAGYRFSHWSLTPGGEAFDFSQSVSSDTTLYAVWEQEWVTYTVVYWLEAPNLPNTADLNSRDSYRYAFTETRRAYAGDTVTITAQNATTDNSAVKYASFHHSQSAVISGNGTTVVNVYFARDLYTIYFDLNAPSINVGTKWRPNYLYYTATMNFGGRTYTSGGAKYTITAKYQQDISDLWPVLSYDASGNPSMIATLSGYADRYFVGWSAGNITWTSKRVTMTEDMMPSSGTSRTIYGSWSEDTVVLYLQYMMESLEGKVPGAVEYNGKYYVSDPTYTQYVENGYVTLFNQKNIDGMTAAGTKWEKTNWRGDPQKDEDGSYHQYLFYNRQAFSIDFDTQGGNRIDSITGLKFGSDISSKKPADPQREGFTFLGWYTDAEYREAFDFAGATMPEHSLKLFAKWESNQFTATFLEKADGKEVGRQGLADGEYVTEPETYVKGEFYEGLGVFLGWYWYLPGTTRAVSYSWETPVHSDLTIFGQWRTDGFTLTYEAGGATGQVPVDSDTYALGVKARVKGADGLSKDNKVFVGWQVDGQGTVYYPGSLIEMNGDTVLVAKWVDPANVARLVYDANYGSPAETLTWMVERYDTVILAGDIFTREGYDLLGWSTKKQATEPDYLPGDEFTIVNDTEHLYAVWKRQTFSVTFVAGLRGSLEGETSFTEIPGGTAWGDAVTVPTPIPNDGYYFTGWTPSFPDTVTASQTYTANFAAQTLVTVFGNGDTFTYDGTPKTVTGYTYTGLGTETLTGLSASVTGTMAGTYPVKVIGTPKVTDANGADITDHFRFVYVDGAMLIEQRAVTITADDAGKTYGDPDPALTAKVSGLVPGESIAYTVSREPGEDVGPYDITVSYTPNQNYNVTATGGTFTISKRDLTVTGNSNTFIYDGTDKTVSGYTYSGLLAGQQIAGLSASRTEKNAGIYDVNVKGAPVITEGGKNVTANYNITTKPGTLIIKRASIPLIITGHGGTFTYDGKPHTVSGYDVEGLLEGHTLSGVSASVTGTIAGTYLSQITGKPVIMDGDVDVTENYDILPRPASMLIKQREVTITADDAGKTYGVSDPALTAKVSGLVPGESISYTVTRTPGENVGPYDILVTASDTTNYKVKTENGTFTITKRNLTITANSSTGNIYDGTEKTVSGYDVAGLVDGDTLSGVSASRSEKNVGTYDVTVEGTPVLMKGSENVTGNYNITTKPGTLVIEKAAIQLTITANSSTGNTYDGTEKTASGYTYSGLLEGHTLSGVSASRTEKNASTYEVNVKGKPVIMDGKTDVTENYVISTKPGSLVIEKASVTITADDAGKTYGDPDPALTAKVSGLVPGESIAYTVSRTPGENVGPYDITVSYTSNKNYNVTATGATFTISQKNLTITAKSSTGNIYDGTEKTVSGYDVTGLVDGDTLSGVSASRSEKNVGTYDVTVEGNPVIMKGAENVTGNYNIATVPGTLIIKPASLTLTITAKSSTENTYDGTEKTVSGYDVEGLLEGHTLSGVSASRTETAAGTYDVSVEGTPVIMDGKTDVSENYTILTVPGSLIIRQKALTITADDAGKTYGDADPAAFTAKVSGLVPGESIDYTVTRTPGENAGLYDIIPAVKENANYSVNIVNGTFTIAKRDLTITAKSSTGNIYDGTEKTVSGYDVTGLVDGDSLSGISVSRSEKNVGTYDVTVEGTPVLMKGSENVTGNYNITTKPGTLVIEKASIALTITANSSTGNIYDGTEKTASGYTYSGLLAGHTLSGVSASVTEKNAGTYEVNVKGKPVIMDGKTDVTENYVISTKPGSLVIEKASVTITADNAGKTYGDPDPALTAKVSGLVPGESIAYTVSRTPGENVGPCDITVSYTSNKNYNVTATGATFTISQKALTVYVESASKTYGDADPDFTIRLDGALVGEDTLLTTFNRAPGEDVNHYAINVILGQNGNYDLTVVPGELEITPKDAVITVDDQTKVAGSADPDFTATVEGLIGDDTLEYTLTRAEGEGVGTYAITATYTPNANYNITVVDGVLRITAASTSRPITTRPSTTTDPTPPATTTPGPAPVTAPPATTPVSPVTTPAAPVTTPTVSIDEPDVPIASLPVTSDRTVIDEPDVPLAATPTPVWALINLLLTIATAIIMLLLLIFYFIGKKNKEDDEDEEQQRIRRENEEAKLNHVLKRKGFWRLLSIVPALGAVIAFILTENMRNPMVLVDRWTLLMALIALVQIVIAILSIKGRKDEEMDEEDETKA
ncbi:MBG domain-containing protein [Zongyangia hominis]|uniref:InlB B-repeat-containing protein n=1 Tax=Zongyangia hominis TaxID=2763677 RepID=A0A926EEI0_9FIRM|nr:MBG domain-containing protein [Zongyangia hominis]MBC8570621.1 InlB B-repeat-containing protein [Zongyangia hominis]